MLPNVNMVEIDPDPVIGALQGVILYDGSFPISVLLKSLHSSIEFRLTHFGITTGETAFDHDTNDFLLKAVTIFADGLEKKKL